ncbi:MAG TPA: hypothetical protein VFL34_16245 [Candidatus Sulfotelmatobacter sp.]|nr:hypothetical protein [Candidatus Sulfotelmatobacter sp.]
MRSLLVLAILLVAACSHAQDSLTPSAEQPLTADAIMARVAANQDRSDALRKQYVYRQHIRIATRRSNGKVQREESADYDVIPAPDDTKKELKLLTGRYWNKGKYEAFQGQPVPGTGSLDGGLIEGFRDDLLNEKTKDGLAKNLFPLTSEEQKTYEFKLLGREVEAGRSVYHIAFRPKDREEITWAGEAYIDAAEFEPVRVFTKLSRRIPLGVRIFLGTDLPGIGFNVVYKRQEDGVWFPATFGTEFKIHAIFFINRQVTISLENSGFEHTHVESRMKVVGPAE